MTSSPGSSVFLAISQQWQRSQNSRHGRSKMWPSERKWPRRARKTGQGWMCPSTTSCVVPVQNKRGPQRRRGQVRRGSSQQWGVQKCAGSTMMVNAPSRIASSLIAVSGAWETTQEELAVVDPGETSPDHSLAYQEAIAECSGDASESNSCCSRY